MRPPVEEIEDDLAAEEENKLINEVRAPATPDDNVLSVSILRNTKHGMQRLLHFYCIFLKLNLLVSTRKKNAPYLYDLVITHALDWPSLTCQWFPDKESYANPHKPPPSPAHPYQAGQQAVFYTSTPPWHSYFRSSPRLPSNRHSFYSQT